MYSSLHLFLLGMSYSWWVSRLCLRQCSHQSAHPAQALLHVAWKKKGQALVKGVLHLRAVCVSHLSDLELL